MERHEGLYSALFEVCELFAVAVNYRMVEVAWFRFDARPFEADAGDWEPEFAHELVVFAPTVPVIVCAKRR
ncbi:hypothetical protein HMPREF2891_03640 [Actinomyces sp. HMSC065F11]|nr:hypothetical protein HMPREF2891_03640 [Actinomyces sp. HMSC065F11]